MRRTFRPNLRGSNRVIEYRPALGIVLSLALPGFVLTSGCDKSAPVAPAGSAQATATAATPAAKVVPIRNVEELHAALKSANPNYNGKAQAQFENDLLLAIDLRATGVTDLSPLTGQPLRAFYAEENPLTDLRPLRGMKLTAISLNDTPVADLGPLHGMPLSEVRLSNTQVRDIGPLQRAPLHELWLNNAPIDDIESLAGSPLISLTIEGTKVRSIAVVRRLLKLERLNMAGCDVTDLTPIAGLPLTRLVFTPGKITTGIEAARTLPRCQEIGPSMEQKGLPAQFWPAYDAGVFR
ncbi:MAG: hypothetical protein C0483_06970 [Pirellula sp.]|nr:hypothetical protein [Pirellula sp.]